MSRSSSLGLGLVLAVAVSGCSLKTFAINMVGDALASGDSVYETDEDLELVRAALPFGLKLTESLLAQSPNHPGLLLTACRGFVLYGYAYVHDDADRLADTDLDAARLMRARARRLYLRGLGYCLRGLERSYSGITQELEVDTHLAVMRIGPNNAERDVPWLYWSAASLGLAISVSRGDAALLARLPDVEVILERALELDEAWDGGALHEFKIVLAGASTGTPDAETLRRHYDRAVELSDGRSASVHVALAEALAVPQQDASEFRMLLQRALAVDPDATPANRLVNLLAHRRARWLAARADRLILDTAGLDRKGAAAP